MKKLLVLLPFLILITGCSIKCDLRIGTNLSVKETITIKESNKTLSLYNTNLKDIPKQRMNEYKNIDEFKQLKLKKEIFENDFTGGVVTAEYSSLNNYKSSGTILSLFSDVSITDLGNVTNVQITDYNPSSFFEPEDTNIDMENIEVNIRFHNKILDNNAQSYDEKTNTYKWVLTSDINSGNISFSIDKNAKRYDIIIKDFLDDNKYTLITLAIILITLGGITVIYYNKNRNANKI